MRGLARRARAPLSTGTGPVLKGSRVWRQRRIALVCPRAGCLYLPVPKAANTSIKAALIGHERGEALPHAFPVHDFESGALLPWDAAYLYTGFRMSFVRNPFARLRSCFENKILAEPETRGTYVDGVHRSFHALGGFRAGMRFEDFVLRVTQIPDARTDIHFVSQHAILVGERGLRVDYVGRVERLDEHWAQVCRLLGAEIPLPHRNRSAGLADDAYRDHYDRRMVRRVERHYAADLALLGYRF